MGQAKLRGSLSERAAAAAEKPKRETKEEARHREMLALAEVTEGHIGVAVHEKGKLIGVHHFARANFVEGGAIPSGRLVSRMHSLLKGDPDTDPKALQMLRHAGFNRLRARDFAGFGLTLRSVVKDPQIGDQVSARIEEVASTANRAALMLIADGEKLHVTIGEQFPDLEQPDVRPNSERTVFCVPMSETLA